MSVDDSQTPAPGRGPAPGATKALPVETANGRPDGANRVSAGGARGIVIDPRMLLVGGGVALIGVAVLAVFLWMVPTAAARELQAACRGMRVEPRLQAKDYPGLCQTGESCA